MVVRTDIFKSKRVSPVPTPPNLNAALRFVDGFMRGRVHGGQLAFVRVFNPLLHILMQMSLVVLDAQDLLSCLLPDALDTARLAAHGVNAHTKACYISGPPYFWNSPDVIRFVIHRALAKHTAI